MSDDCWAVLDIAATRDEREIRRVYARQLKRFRPEEDPVGFQRLVEARDRALLLAKLSDERLDFSDEVMASLPDRTFSDIVVVAKTVHVDSAATDTDAVPQNQADARQRQVLHAVHATLDGLIDAIKTNSSSLPQAWEAESWAALFNQTALLGLNEHRAFQRTIARRLVEFLPDPDSYHTDDLANFEVGNGPCAVVEQIENECQFTWFGLGFAQVAGQRAADRYFSWLARIQTAKALIERRQNSETAYSNPKNGLPLFLQEDKIVLFRDVDLLEFFQKAEEQGSWPFKIDIRSLFTSGSRLADAGFGKAGFVVAAVICALSASLNALRVDWVMTALLCVGASVACRVWFSATHCRRTVQRYTSYVKEVDGRGIIFPADRRTYLAKRRKRPALSGHLWVLEIAATIMLVLPLMTFATSWRYSDLMDQPAATVLADQVVSLFETAAENDAVETTRFVSLAIGMKHAASLLENGGSEKSIRLRDITNPLDIVRFRSELTELSKQTTKSVKPLTPLIARQRKLKELAELYRQASFYERRHIEKILAQWGPLLGSASLSDPLFEAALWELLPPRTREARSLMSPEQKLRQMLVRQFLNSHIASISSLEQQNIAQNADQLQLLLNASDSLLLSVLDASVVNVDLEAFKGADRFWDEFSRKNQGGEYSGSTKRVLDDMIHSVIGRTDRSDYVPRLAAFNVTLPVWSEEVIGWGGFLNSTSLCLNTFELNEQNVVRTTMSEIIETAQTVNEQEKSRYWSSATNQIFDIPFCRARFAASNGTDAGRDMTQAQIRNLVVTKNTSEAIKAVRYVKVANEKGYWGDLGTFADSYLAYDSLQKALPQQALHYLDGAADQFNLCRQVRALRGAILEALGEKARALQEFRASQHTYVCSPKEAVFTFDDADIDNAIEKLEKETEVSRAVLQ